MSRNSALHRPAPYWRVRWQPVAILSYRLTGKAVFGLPVSEEVRPEKSHGGFVCAICERESKHRIFPTLEVLWLDHLFRPLEDCINTKLAVAQAVALYRTDHGGSTWARLVWLANLDSHLCGAAGMTAMV